MIKLGNLKKIQ